MQQQALCKVLLWYWAVKACCIQVLFTPYSINWKISLDGCSCLEAQYKMQCLLSWKNSDTGVSINCVSHCNTHSIPMFENICTCYIYFNQQPSHNSSPNWSYAPKFDYFNPPLFSKHILGIANENLIRILSALQIGLLKNQHLMRLYN